MSAGLTRFRVRAATSPKELKVVNTSIIVVRTGSGEVKAYHNICRHRGNKLVWNDMPLEETSGVCRQFTCKYHAWRYDLDGNLTFVQQEEEFFDLDRAAMDLVSVHCDVWEGFIFVNFAKTPEQSLREFLGPMVTDLEGYPFGQLTSRWCYRSEVKANWKLYMDAFQEFYHAPITAREPVTDRVFKGRRRGRFRGPALSPGRVHTGWSARPACGPGKCLTRCASRWTTSVRAGCSGPGRSPIWARCRWG